MMLKMPHIKSKCYIQSVVLWLIFFFQAENLFQELQEHFQALTATLNLRNILFHLIANAVML